jgi:AraC family transcriptional regulator
MNPNPNPNPTITTHPPFTVIGLLYRGKNENNEIPQLWEAFFPDRAAEIQHKVNPCVAYGVMDHADPETGEFDYVACYEVSDASDIPDGMVCWHIPAQTYAVFKGALPKIMEMYEFAFRQWLPTSDYRQADGPEFELYGEDFNPSEDKFDLYLYVPVVERND